MHLYAVLIHYTDRAGGYLSHTTVVLVPADDDDDARSKVVLFTPETWTVTATTRVWLLASGD